MQLQKVLHGDGTFMLSAVYMAQFGNQSLHFKQKQRQRQRELPHDLSSCAEVWGSQKCVQSVQTHRSHAQSSLSTQGLPAWHLLRSQVVPQPEHRATTWGNILLMFWASLAGDGPGLGAQTPAGSLMQPAWTTDALLWVHTHHLSVKWQYMWVQQLQKCAVLAGKHLKCWDRSQLHPAPLLPVD